MCFSYLNNKYVHFDKYWDKYLLCWACLCLIWSRGGGLFTPSSEGGDVSIQRGTYIRRGTFIYFWFIVQGVLLLRRVCLFGTIEYMFSFNLPNRLSETRNGHWMWFRSNVVQVKRFIWVLGLKSISHYFKGWLILQYFTGALSKTKTKTIQAATMDALI